MKDHPTKLNAGLRVIIGIATHFREGTNTIASTNNGCRGLFTLYDAPPEETEHLVRLLDGNGLGYQDWQRLETSYESARRQATTHAKLTALSQVRVRLFFFYTPLITL
jgi:hypothetical protein